MKALFVVGTSTAIVIGGVLYGKHLIETGPKPLRQAPPQMASLVRAITVRPAAHTIYIKALGVVMPSIQITLSAQVSGEIIKVHPQFFAGGIIPAKEVLIQIDPQDYQLAIPAKEAQLETARYEWTAELGQQAVAQREWELLGMNEDAPELEKELALRKPQLRQKEANVRSAEAALEKVRLDLSRTTIKSPFNALILTTQVNIGDMATLQKPLATLVCTDTFWIQVSIPVDHLKWLKIPRNTSDESSPAKVFCPRGKVHEGRIIALLGELEPAGRMAQLRVEVSNPLALGTGHANDALLLDEFVSVQFEGVEVQDVCRIPRDALREGDTVWSVDSQNALRINNVEVVWSDETSALVRGLFPDVRVVLSDLAGPVEGMTVQVQQENIPKDSEAPAERIENPTANKERADEQ